MLYTLTSHHNVTRRSVLQKVPGRALNALPVLVNIGFQVLFHSPPGVLFTFPSRYCSLSVTKSYLALEGGPPAFMQDSSCPALLRIQIRSALFKIQDFYLLRSGFPAVFFYKAFSLLLSIPQRSENLWFGLFPFRSPLLRKSCLLSFPPVTKMFQFTGFPSLHYEFM